MDFWDGNGVFASFTEKSPIPFKAVVNPHPFRDKPMKRVSDFLCVFLVIVFTGCAPLDKAPPDQTKDKIATLEALAREGSPKALCELGMLYLDDGDIETGRHYLEQSAERGSQKAIDYFLSQAHQGDVNAMIFYGDLLYLGNGISQDVKRALQWYMAAIQQGSGWGMLRLAEAYSSGDFIKIDKRAAFYWYKTAAETGLPEAQFTLAEVYREGDLVSENRCQAVSWYIKAADAGNSRAKTFLQDFIEAEEIPLDEKQPALDWLKKQNNFPQ